MQQNGRYTRQYYEDWNAFLKSLHPTSDPQAARLMEDFRLVAHQFHHLNEASMEASGLSYAQNRILLHLMFSEWQGRGDGLNPSEISAHQGTSRNTISALIRNLEEEGLVERLLDQSDRRRFNIVLTDAGRQKVREHASHHVDVINDLFAVLSQDEMANLSELLRALYQRAKTLKE